MKTTVFDNRVATAVEDAVMEVYNCSRGDILQFKDSEEKKAVVFVLFHWYRYSQHCIGKAYQMTYLYVPTVAKEFEYWSQRDEKVRDRIDLVLAKLMEKNLLMTG